MGCVESRIDKDERVRKCKERKKLMKQLLVHRKDFADALYGYLRGLRNTGVALRQFTESEWLRPEDIYFESSFLPSPPPRFLPSPLPPPPPPFSLDSSPDSRNFEGNQPERSFIEKVIEVDDGSGNSPPPSYLVNSPWDFWEPFGSSSRQYEKKSEIVEHEEEEKWAETKTEFVEEDEESEESEEGEEGEEDEIIINCVEDVLPEEQQPVEFLDDASWMKSWHTEETSEMSMIVGRRKKSLACIIRELDDYFLEASDGRDVAVLMDANMGESFLYRFNESKRKRYSSAKVLSALPWRWSSRPLQSMRGYRELSGPDELRSPGVHCLTLEKIYAEEQKLYKLVKEEEITKVEYARKSRLLQQQEEENQDLIKTEKTRSLVESLQSDISSLKQSIRSTSSTIIQLINDELHPQIIALTSGLMHMWQTMHECHQLQDHISQHLNHLMDQHNTDQTTEYRRQAASELMNEVNSWYVNFCKLEKAQKEYVEAIFRWSQLTYCLEDEGRRSIGPSSVNAIAEEWLFAVNKIPNKRVSEAIQKLLSSVHSIITQQDEEVHQKKRLNKLEKKFQRESNSLSKMELKFARSLVTEGANSILSSKHRPLIVKREEFAELKKEVDAERAKYTKSVKATKVIILQKLQTSLPDVFRALMVFATIYTRGIETVQSLYPSGNDQDDESSSIMS